MKRSELKRKAPMRRVQLVRKAPLKRDWRDAEAKKRAEGACRYCGSKDWLESAHVIGREYDRPRKVVEMFGDELGAPYLVDGPLYVDPDDVVPLCKMHHELYDARRLDLLSVLTLPEQARAVLHVGVLRALNRICGDTVFLPAPMALGDDDA